MNENVIRVNLHTHSTMSDGGLSPESLALTLVQRGVSYASLTDHDTMAGSVRFRETLARHGGTCIDGIELTVSTPLGVAHLLSYGHDISNAALIAMLPQTPVSGPRTQGIPEIKDAISVIHGAGGAAFLAHPLHLTQEISELESLLDELALCQLDGLEAIYAGYGDSDTDRLRSLAARHNLTASCGGDFHNDGMDRQSDGMDMSETDWIAFRDVLLARSSAFLQHPPLPPLPAVVRKNRISLPGKIVVRIVLPAVTALALFIVSFFLIIIPRDEALILERKKETIRELTDSAVSILSEYYTLAQNGSMGTEQAKAEAVKRLRDLRYGRENKDYFWITDMFPRMIMHPYRTELEGSDLTSFRDEDGQAVFVEFVKAVSLKDEGYIEYLWQWEDDQSRIVPKLSFVRHFIPWDWVIGTGIYLDDVKAQIAILSLDLIWICLIITAILALIITLMVRQSLVIERGKIEAENALRESRERYRALADGATDGTVIVMNGACNFANGALLSMTGYAEKEIQLLRINELLSGYDDNDDYTKGSSLECRLAKRSGEMLEVRVSATPIALASHKALVLSIKDTSRTISDSDNILNEISRKERRIDYLVSRMETDALFLSLPASRFAKETIFCLITDPVAEVAGQMKRFPSQTCIISDSSGTALGIVTSDDIAFRSTALDGNSFPTAGTIMTSPIVSIRSDESVSEAIIAMRKFDIDRIALRSPDGKICSILMACDIAMLQAGSLSSIRQEALKASSISALTDIADHARDILRPLAAAGAKPEFILRNFSSVQDSMTENLAGIAIKKIGAPPAEWVFLAFGSMGREEYIPGSDQDNALVWKHTDGDLEKEREFFGLLGENICAGLEKIGLPLCPGNVMASNPVWNAPLHEWEQRFERGIHEPEPDKLLDLEILLDFRRVAGSIEMAEELREKAFTQMGNQPLFFLQLAQSVLNRKITGSNLRFSANTNLKEIGASLSGFIRVYAMKNAVKETNTFDRLEALADLGVFKFDTRDQFIAAFGMVLSMRLARALSSGPEAGKFSAHEEALLSYASEQAMLLQKRIGFDFLGSAL